MYRTLLASPKDTVIELSVKGRGADQDQHEIFKGACGV